MDRKSSVRFLFTVRRVMTKLFISFRRKNTYHMLLSHILLSIDVLFPHGMHMYTHTCITFRRTPGLTQGKGEVGGKHKKTWKELFSQNNLFSFILTPVNPLTQDKVLYSAI